MFGSFCRHAALKGLLAVMSCALFAACVDDARIAPGNGLPTLTKTSAAIIGGESETGWSGVGAVTHQDPELGYLGSYCSGALIAEDWVLTAAHCLIEANGSPVTAEQVKFYIGTDANPGISGLPISGQLYAAQEFFLHPDFDAETLAHDVGLIRLAEPAVGADTYPINSLQPFDVTFQAASVFFVGYGATDGINRNGEGIKRSTHIQISDYNADFFYSTFQGSGVCFGDSGGPSFLEIEGEQRIVGVASASGGDTEDPCEGWSQHVRIDRSSLWILQTIGSTVPDCHEHQALCGCLEACRDDGTCDNALCPTFTCRQIYDCSLACGSCPVECRDCVENCNECHAACESAADCQRDCFTTGTVDARDQYLALQLCFQTNCGDLPDMSLSQCLRDSCGDEVDTCFASVGPWTCEEVYTCLRDCPEGDNDCRLDCNGQGTAEAQLQIDAMLSCWNTQCAGLTGEAFTDCAWLSCETPTGACLPARPVGEQNCEQIYNCVLTCTSGDELCRQGCIGQGTAQAQDDLYALDDCLQQHCAELAGDLPAWQACSYEYCQALVAVCFPPAHCDLRGGQCPAETACYPTTAGTTDCLPSLGLLLDAPCESGSATLPCADGLICTVVDGEARCRSLCFDDEECSGGAVCYKPAFVGEELAEIGMCLCVDRDADGHCAGEDCDDAAADTHPGAQEVCADGRDNDCDSLTDEECTQCAHDADCDGTPTESDCNDGDATVHPGAAEVCADSIDNDCDSLTDEDCQQCPGDLDCDGSADDLDCDDSSAAVHPGAEETCGDNVDQDCDSQTDEDCPQCEDDADCDGTATALDCNDNDADIHPGAVEACGDGIDNNCNQVAEEGCASTCVDADGDGACATVDCVDDDADIYPGADELCGDDRDNNCDGQTDEQCGTVGNPDNGGDGGGCSAAGPAPTFGLLGLLAVAWWFVRRPERHFLSRPR